MESSNLGLYANLRKIISIIDQLRDIGLQKYISLPRIAVLGTQSSGKSSLLEMIVGIDFLPRGEVIHFLYPVINEVVGRCHKKTSRTETCSHSWSKRALRNV